MTRHTAVIVACVVLLIAWVVLITVVLVVSATANPSLAIPDL